MKHQHVYRRRPYPWHRQKRKKSTTISRRVWYQQYFWHRRGAGREGVYVTDISLYTIQNICAAQWTVMQYTNSHNKNKCAPMSQKGSIFFLIPSTCRIIRSSQRYDVNYQRCTPIPSPIDKQFCLAKAAIFTSYITFQSNQNKIFQPTKMFLTLLYMLFLIPYKHFWAFLNL